jgi:hypothetical protein
LFEKVCILQGIVKQKSPSSGNLIVSPFSIHGCIFALPPLTLLPFPDFVALGYCLQGPMIIACAEGGTSIEELAETNPEKIVKVPVNIAEGITEEQVMEVVDCLNPSGDKRKAGEQIRALYNLFIERDCSMVEVSRGNQKSLSQRRKYSLTAFLLNFCNYVFIYY